MSRPLTLAGVPLPPPPDPVGAYDAVVVRAVVGRVSGQLPFRDGVLVATGHAGTEGGPSEEKLRDAAARCALNALAQVGRALGGFERLDGVLALDGCLACVLGFTRHAAVLDGASELLVRLLGERGRHARSAVGVASLPGDASVELWLTFAVRPGGFA